MSQRVAIVGIGQTNHRYRRPDVNHVELLNEAVRLALQDAQLTMKDVDAVVMGNMELFEGHYIPDAMSVDGSGAYLKPGLRVNTGGTVGATTLVAAATHVASGVFNTVLAIGWEKQDAASTLSGLLMVRDPLYDRDKAAGAAGLFATLALRYMRESGCREEHAALVRVKAAQNARRNPHAHLKLNITADDVLNSRLLVWPLRLLHLSPTSCGACALVLAGEERAKKISNKPVWIRDHVTAHRECFTHVGGIVEAVPHTPSHEAAALKLYKRNGITNPRRQMQMMEMYDPSSWAEMQYSEWFHICEKGEGWKIAEKGITALDGEFPINPSGGVVSTNPIGASAMLRPAEAALQIRGDAGEGQVTRQVNVALATGFGGWTWTVMFLLSRTPD